MSRQLVFIVFWFLIGVIQISSTEVNPDDDDLPFLTANVIKLADTTIGEYKFMRRAIWIDKYPLEIWDLLTNPEEIKNFMPKLKKYELLESYPDSQIFLCAAKPKWYLKTYECKVSVILQPFSEIWWIRTDGDFDEFRCCWLLEQQNDSSTMATYHIYMELGGIIPEFLVKWGVKKGLDEMMGYCQEWIESKSTDKEKTDQQK